MPRHTGRNCTITRAPSTHENLSAGISCIANLMSSHTHWPYFKAPARVQGRNTGLDTYSRVPNTAFRQPDLIFTLVSIRELN